MLRGRGFTDLTVLIGYFTCVSLNVKRCGGFGSSVIRWLP
jgi:hypothetical protein